MELGHLRCFVAVADALHFGRAARQLDLLPAALSRSIRLLEQELRVRLFTRTTRQVALTATGLGLLEEARTLVALADAMTARVRAMGRDATQPLRLGAIDSAAAGLVPRLLQDFRGLHPDTIVEIVEDKSVRLIPQLLSGQIDLAIIRPPDRPNPDIEMLPLVFETAVIALPNGHRLARLDLLTVADLADEPLIVPARRARPHSYDLTIKLFADAGLRPTIAQQADEKQTIVGLVAAGVGSAIVPRWTGRMAVSGVVYRPLDVGAGSASRRLPLAAAWVRKSRDSARDRLVAVLMRGLDGYVTDA